MVRMAGFEPTLPVPQTEVLNQIEHYILKWCSDRESNSDRTLTKGEFCH